VTTIASPCLRKRYAPHITTSRVCHSETRTAKLKHLPGVWPDSYPGLPVVRWPRRNSRATAPSTAAEEKDSHSAISETRSPGRGLWLLATMSPAATPVPVISTGSLRGVPEGLRLLFEGQFLITVRVWFPHGYLRLTAPTCRLSGPNVRPGKVLRVSKLHKRSGPPNPPPPPWPHWGACGSAAGASNVFPVDSCCA